MEPETGTGSAPVPLAQSAAPISVGIDAVVGDHMNPYASGAARFNQILAERLGVPSISVLDPLLETSRRPLLSFKEQELDEAEREALAATLGRHDPQRTLRVYLHAYGGSALEERLVREAEIVYCGNSEIAAQVSRLNSRVHTLWAPGLILDTRRFSPAAHSIFSFGMAHKVRADMFARLRDLLEGVGESYSIYMSNANHATATLREAQIVFDEMRAVFPRNLYFMGTLSDVAISNYLRTTTYFAAFFRNGVRANNTSVLSAMEHGSVVITNLDDFSPDYLVHMENVIDINSCERLPFDPLEHKRLGVRAIETARALSWDRLVAAIHRPETIGG
jgi:hypothetical protein